MLNTLFKRIGTLESAPPWGMPTALGTLIVAFAAMVIGTTITGLLLGQTALATIAGWSIGMIALALFVSFTRSRDRDALGIGITQTPLPLVLLLSLGIAIALDLIGIAITQTGSVVLETIPFRSDAAAGIVGVLLVVVFQPIGEELAFRGVIYPALRQGLGTWMGFIMTAVFYAVFHLLAYTSVPQNTLPFLWYALILPLLNGLYLNAVRAYTGSTRAAIVAHVGLGIFVVLRVLLLTS